MAYLAGLSLLWGAGVWTPVRESLATRVSPERVAFVAVPSTPTLVPATTRASHMTARAAKQMHDASHPVTADTASRPNEQPAAMPARSGLAANVGTLAPSSAARLAPPRGSSTPWYSPPLARNPFAPAPRLSATERDSTLSALGVAVPELAARRVETQGERDARAREAMLKMRLAGRILLVPPDNSGGLITSSIPLPIFSGGPSRAKRRRDSVAVAIDKVIRDRLSQRADSLRRWRADSAARRLPSPR